MHYETGDGLKSEFIDSVRGFIRHAWHLIFLQMDWLDVLIVYVDVWNF